MISPGSRPAQKITAQPSPSPSSRAITSTIFLDVWVVLPALWEDQSFAPLKRALGFRKYFTHRTIYIDLLCSALVQICPPDTALSLAGSLCLFVAVFYKPLGLSDAWEWTALVLAPLCFIPLIVLQRRRRKARLAAGSEAIPSADEEEAVVVSLSRCRYVTFGPVLAALHRNWTAFFDTRRYLDHYVCFYGGHSLACMEVLVAKGLTPM